MAPRGRKPRGEYTGKSVVFSTRLRADTKEALANAAKRSGRSLSQEAEHRLRRSFDEDRDLIERFGGRKNYGLLRLIGSCLDANFNPNDPEATWLDDPYVFDQTLQAVVAALQAFRPKGNPKFKDPQSPMMEAAAELQGVEGAGRRLQAVISADDQLLLDTRGNKNVAAFIKEALGDLVERVSIVEGTAADLRRAADQLEKKAKGPKRRKKQ
jgi:hypothetical protein